MCIRDRSKGAWRIEYLCSCQLVKQPLISIFLEPKESVWAMVLETGIIDKQAIIATNIDFIRIWFSKIEDTENQLLPKN